MKKSFLFVFLLLVLLLASCGREKHSHAFSEDWKSDQTNHWHECVGDDCDEKSDIALHTFDDGVIVTRPTATKEGTKVFTCTVCGITKTDNVQYSRIITFDSMGGSNCETMYCIFGDDQEFASPTKNDCTFAGWYTNKDFTNKVDSSNDVTNNTTLYARWQVKIEFNNLKGLITSNMYDETKPFDTLPVSNNNGLKVSGWYYDSDLNYRVWPSDVVGSKKTLYASYTDEIDSNVLARTENYTCEEDVSFKVKSSVTLTNKNISEYIGCYNLDESRVDLSVSDGVDEFVVSGSSNFVKGRTYTLKALSSKVRIISFNDQEIDENVTTISFTVNSENIEESVLKDIYALNNNDICYYEQNCDKVVVYGDDYGKDLSLLLVEKGNTDYSFAENDIIALNDSCVTGTKLTEITRDYSYYKIITYCVDSVLDDDTVYYCFQITNAELEDFFEYINVHKVYDVDLSSNEHVLRNNLPKIEENLLASDGLDKIITSSVLAAYSTPTVLSNLGEKKVNLANVPSSEDLDLSIDFDVSKQGNKLVLSCTITFAIEVKEILKLSFSIGLKDTIGVTADSNIGYENTVDGDSRLLVSVGLNLFNEVSITLSAEAELIGTGAEDKTEDEKKIDISDEMQDIIKNGFDNINDLAEYITGSPFVETNLGEELEYVDICEVPIGTLYFPIPVTAGAVSLSAELSSVIAVGAKASLTFELTHTFEEQYIVANGVMTPNGAVMNGDFFDFEFYKIQKENKLSITITLQGKIGIRCGLRLELGVEVLFLVKVAVGIEVGPYVELTGFARFKYELDKNGNADTSFAGGIFITCGLYIDVSLVVDITIDDFEIDLYSKKIEIFRFGSVILPTGFYDCGVEDPIMNKNKTVNTNTRKYTFSLGQPIFNINYINLSTGEEKENAWISWGGFEKTIKLNPDHPNYNLVELDGDTVRLKDGIRDAIIDIEVEISVKNTKLLAGGNACTKMITLRFIDQELFNSDAGGKVGVQYVACHSGYTNTVWTPDDKAQTLSWTEISTHVWMMRGLSYDTPEIDLSNVTIPAGYYIDQNDMWYKIESETFKYPVNVNDIDLNWSGERTSIPEDTDPKITRFIYVLKLKSYNVNVTYMKPIIVNGRIKGYEKDKDITVSMGKNECIIPGYIPANVNGYTLNGWRDNYNVYADDKYISDISVSSYRDSSIWGWLFNRTLFTSRAEEITKNGIVLYPVYEEKTYTVKWNLNSINEGLITRTYKAVDFTDGKVNAIPPYAIGEEIGDTIVAGYYSAKDGVVKTDFSDITQDDTFCIHLELSSVHISFITTNNVFISGGTYRVGSDFPEITNEIVAKALERQFGVVDNITDAAIVEEHSSTVGNGDGKVFHVSYNSSNYNMIFKASTKPDGAVISDDDIASDITTSGSLANIDFFKVPSLVYYDTTTNKQYTVDYWTTTIDQVETKVYPGEWIRYSFGNATFTPHYEKSDIIFTINILTESYSKELVVNRTISGAFLGKSVDTILSENNIEITKTDFRKINEYTLLPFNKTIGLTFDSNDDLVTELSFIAYFQETKIEYSYTFEALDGKFADGNSSKVYKCGGFDEINFTEKPQLEGHVFLGWNNVNDQSKIMNIIGQYGGTSDKVFYAVYTESDTPKTVTISAGKVGNDEFLFAHGTTTIISEAYEGYLCTVYIPTQELNGQTYQPTALKDSLGNYYDIKNSSSSFIVNDDMTLTVIYSEPVTTTFMVQLDAQEGYVGYYKHTTIYFDYNEKLTLPIAYREKETKNYLFRGWSTSRTEYVELTDTEALRNYILYAFYIEDEASPFTITFDASGVMVSETYDLYYMDDTSRDFSGSFDNCFDMSINVLPNETYSFDLKPEKQGCRFIGWKTTHNGEIIDVTNIIATENTIYYAVYEKIACTITLYSGIGVFADESTKKIINTYYNEYLESFEKPIVDGTNIVFSHWTSNDTTSTIVLGEASYYAQYATIVNDSNITDLINANPSGSFIVSEDIIVEETIVADFSGVLNGNGYTIKCEKVIFDSLSGEIRNTNLVSYPEENLDVSNKANSSYGLIVNTITTTGAVIDCYVHGNIETSICATRDISIGVLAGSSYGLIENVVSYSRIIVDVNSQSEVSAGFFAGINYGAMNNVFAENGELNIAINNSVTIYAGNISGKNYGTITKGLGGVGPYYSYESNCNCYLDKIFVGGVCGFNYGTLDTCSAQDNNLYIEEFYFAGDEANGLPAGNYTVTYNHNQQYSLQCGPVTFGIYDETKPYERLNYYAHYYLASEVPDLYAELNKYFTNNTLGTQGSDAITVNCTVVDYSKIAYTKPEIFGLDANKIGYVINNLHN